MKTIGIIGYGSMGRMLAERLLRSGRIEASRLFIHTRTEKVTEDLKTSFPSVQVTDLARLVRESDLLFVCVPPDQVKSILEGIRETVSAAKHVISLASVVSVSQIETVVTGKVTKLIPSFTSESGHGVSLACHNAKVAASDKQSLLEILEPLGKIEEVPEDQIEVYTELTSCSPGILSALFRELVRSAVRHGGVEEAHARDALVHTLYGLSKLYVERGLTFDETIRRVARKGGMTEIGIRVVEENVSSVYDEIFETTLKRYDEKKRAMDGLFDGGRNPSGRAE